MLKKAALFSDCYEFQAIISEIHGSDAILNETFFYPESGGQLSDIGFINGIQVLHVKIEGEKIFHTLADVRDLKIGSTVNCMIDKDRRLQNSIQHTGQHLLSGILLKKYNIHTNSFRMGESVSTIDVESDYLPDLNEVEEYVMAAIQKALPVHTQVYEDLNNVKELPLRKKPAVSKNVRVVQVADFDITPCGGTHVNNTKDLLIFKIVKGEKYKKGYRLEFVYGKKAYCIFQDDHSLLAKLSVLFSSPIHSLHEQIDLFYQSYLEQKKEITSLKEEFFLMQIMKDFNQFKETQKTDFFVRQYDVDTNLLKQGVKECLNHTVMIVFLYNEKGGFCAGISPELQMNIKDIVIDYIKGGGGSSELIQGKIKQSFIENSLIEHLKKNITR